MSQLKISSGTTFPISVTFQRNGVAETLVGATVRFTVKTSEHSTDTTDSDASIIKNLTSGTAEGLIVITILPEDTATLTPGKYFYDIKVETATGDIYKIDEGTIKLDGSPTNRLA